MNGYSVTLQDFEQLLTYPPYRQVIAPLVEGWFDGRFITNDEAPVLETAAGERLSLLQLHTAIQANASMQYQLYQNAMSLWH